MYIEKYNKFIAIEQSLSDSTNLMQNPMASYSDADKLQYQQVHHPAIRETGGTRYPKGYGYNPRGFTNRPDRKSRKWNRKGRHAERRRDRRTGRDRSRTPRRSRSAPAPALDTQEDQLPQTHNVPPPLHHHEPESQAHGHGHMHVPPRQGMYPQDQRLPTGSSPYYHEENREQMFQQMFPETGNERRRRIQSVPTMT